MITMKALRDQWAGFGPKVHYFTYPNGEEGNQTYHVLTQYRQGLVFEFR